MTVRESIGGYLICREPGHTADNQQGLSWCDHILEYISNGKDGETLEPGERIMVPVFPTKGVYAEVILEDKNHLPGGACPMTLEFTPDIGKPYSVELGYWNPGEGRYSMRAVILDYVQSKSDPRDWEKKPGYPHTRCPNNGHSMESAKRRASYWDESIERMFDLWNVVMEKACTACVEELAGVDPNGFLDPDAVSNRPRWAPSTTGVQGSVF